ncbi:YhcH/YjgK/YiaL family protein [Paratractidigestivibacter sp.]|uniref:YhcH/YjgK/YiaL family protein n=1 Tax=Paratractidigestivibacter sp. TaxID=2847316 RepID=UPI002AC8EC1F|nr:YhcH/YjgK/YiaL family protein [Paratractidigestivibacter sp.]
MIVDSLSNIGRYRGFSRGLDVLIDWLGANNPAELDLGKNEILGSKVFANVMEATTREPADGQYEWHRRYIDVQMDLEGEERFFVTPGKIEVRTPFDELVDAGLGVAADGNDDVIEGSLANGHFVVFVPGEAHMPTVVPAGVTTGLVRKICFKLLADEFWDEA